MMAFQKRRVCGRYDVAGVAENTASSGLLALDYYALDTSSSCY